MPHVDWSILAPRSQHVTALEVAHASSTVCRPMAIAVPQWRCKSKRATSALFRSMA
jgi:hypothetical protein